MRREKLGWAALVIMLIAWAAVLSWMQIQKFLSFRSGGDLGIFVQAMWTTAHGRPFYMSVLGGPANFLGHHFAPLLVGLAPLYNLWPDARLLLIAQPVALALAGVPLYIFTRRRLGVAAALLLVLAYLLYAPLHFVALSDFHEISLAVPLLMASGAALLDKHLRWSLFWLILAILAKEEVILIALGFGAYLFIFMRQRRLGMALMIASSLALVLIVKVLIPILNNGNNYTFFNRYAVLGGTPGAMLQTLLLHPVTVLKLVTRPDKLWFVAQLLIPLAGLPLLGVPAIALALPTLVYLQLSDYIFAGTIQFYYQAPMIPFLFLATVVTLQRIRAWDTRNSPANPTVASNPDRSPWLPWWRSGLRLYTVAMVAVVVLTLITARFWSPLPGGQAYTPELYRVTTADREAASLLATIPADASVGAFGEYVSWVANRFRMSSTGGPAGIEVWPTTATEYLAIRQPEPPATIPPAAPHVVRPQPDTPIRVERYALVKKTAQGLALWKWRGPESDAYLPRYDVAFEQGLTLLAAGMPPDAPAWGPVVTTAPGSTLPIWLAWNAATPLDHRITFSLHLLDESGKRVAQVDREMGGGYFPTTLWHRYEKNPSMADEFPLELPPDLAPGRYHLLAGAFETENVAALSRTDGGGQWVELAQIAIKR
jgi:uncharacterized membrane protein